MSSSCASLGRLVQKCRKPCKLLVGIVVLKRKTAVYDWYNCFKVNKKCWKMSLMVADLQLP
jgi:hypothetical protein